MDYENDQKVIETLNKDFFPLFKIEFEETYRFRDVDVDYLLDAEPHELLRKGHRAVIYVKDSKDEDWKVLYDGLSMDLHEAALEIREIKNNLSMWRRQYIDNPPVMFVYQNQVFKQPYVMFDQLCIAGYPIEPWKYYVEDDAIKVDFFKSYVRPIPKNTVLLHAEQLYFNGELLYSTAELKELGMPLYMSSDLINFIKKAIPEATHYESDMESGTLK